MPTITKELALNIPPKLRKAFRVEEKAGRGHDLVKIWYGDVWIGQYGVTRSSKKNSCVNYISRQLYLSLSQAYDLARCPLTVEEYIVILQEKQQIPTPEDEPESAD